MHGCMQRYIDTYVHAPCIHLNYIIIIGCSSASSLSWSHDFPLISNLSSNKLTRGTAAKPLSWRIVAGAKVALSDGWGHNHGESEHGSGEHHAHMDAGGGQMVPTLVPQSSYRKMGSYDLKEV